MRAQDRRVRAIAWIGGGCTTEEPILPGFRCNLHSNFYIGFSQAPLMRDLELARFGCRRSHRRCSTA
jgi:hypothetical protein